MLRLSAPGLLLSLLAACGPAPEPAAPGAEDAAAATPPSAPAAVPPAPSEPAASDAVQQWRCGEDSISLRHDSARGVLVLTHARGELELPAAATDGRHADANGNAFSENGQEAELVLSGQPPRGCVRSEPLGAVWDDARTRGVLFRAVGNEPGWLVEISGEHPATLHALLDYGQRRLDGVATGALADGRGYQATLEDGGQLLLHIDERACEDPMSGESFPVVARLRIDGQSLSGCGRFLDR